MYQLDGYGIHAKDLIRDPIYGFIEIPQEFIDIIDHPLFQRLRWVSQLSLEQLVYPSAQHSRFEHSLGSMHLAMQAAITLINNSEKEFDQAFRKDSEFSGMRPREQRKSFILSAGVCGLLHDLGHAPFSHTLEEATSYSKHNIDFHHESATYKFAEKLIKDVGYLAYCNKALRVLNKKFDITGSELNPVEIILRLLIDGPIDVDKGDYLLRDSYHCGVSYGIYDYHRLWRSIRIFNKSHIGVTEKGAIEAWSLRIARYKMHKNVYKHHARNITDALLVEIISDALDDLDPKSEKWLDIFPFRDPLGMITDDTQLTKIIYWTDNTLLKELESLGNAKIKGKIQSFMKRDLHKRGFEINLAAYPETVEKRGELRFKVSLRKLQKKLKVEKNLDFSFIIYQETPAPVFEKEVQASVKTQEGIVVVSKNGSLLPLSEYLNFSINAFVKHGKTDEFLLKVPSPIHQLHVFVPEASKKSAETIATIRKEIEKTLSAFSP